MKVKPDKTNEMWQKATKIANRFCYDMTRKMERRTMESKKKGEKDQSSQAVGLNSQARETPCTSIQARKKGKPRKKDDDETSESGESDLDLNLSKTISEYSTEDFSDDDDS